jgi:glycosyltransferase involved in cell wall biosynthesis
MKNRTAEVSIVVACRNEAGMIGRFIESLLQQEFGGIEWEAVIADGMSTDGTRRILEEYSQREPRLRVIDNPRKVTPSGLNAAVRAASGDVIVRMDAHTEYATDYVRRCVDELHTRKVDNVGGPARTKSDTYMRRAIAAAYHSPFACGGARFHDENYEGYVETVTYGCWRKSTLERLGLFDESLIRNQDDELNLRIIQSGGKVWQSPKIVSWYYPRKRSAGCSSSIINTDSGESPSSGNTNSQHV